MIKPIRLVDHPHIDLERGNHMHVDTKLRVKFLNNVAVFFSFTFCQIGCCDKDVYNYYYNFILSS